MTSQKLTSLLQLAAEDFKGGSAPTTLPRHAAYLLSQAAEKAARAVCEYEGIQVGTTHNIGQIGALLPTGHPMRDVIEAQNYHSSASTRFRYPDAAGRVPTAPSPAELQRRIADVEGFLVEVQKFVSHAVDDDDGAAPPAGLNK